MVQWLIEHLEFHGVPLYRQPLSLRDFGLSSQKLIWIYGLHNDMDPVPAEVLPQREEGTTSSECPGTYKSRACAGNRNQGSCLVRLCPIP